MKKLLIVSLLFGAFMVPSTFARTVEIDVYGMTCAFCADSLDRKFKNMEHVSKVTVSLKNKKIRLETDSALPTVKAIKQAVLDTGFTPTKVTVVNGEKK
ncbi:heavy-metal-associated domain-containing protein [Sulfurospirillum sp. 1612]|uniref:heavy-metal-associated domain-containing protein n=1 Tax=Sulfurospirillum sp. 1612 TaxID=3094835 RepID=UPI002F92FC95